MATKTKKTRKSVSKSTAMRGTRSTARAVARPAKKAIVKPVAKRMKKPVVKSKKKLIAKPVAKRVKKPAARSATKSITKPVAVTMSMADSESRLIREITKKPEIIRPMAVRTKTKVKIRQTHSSTVNAEARRTIRLARLPQFAYMKPPGAEHAFEVGNTVEVFCDHEKNNDRVRGWVKGIVVQVDNKLVAVQFRSNVYLTDGWMVPDHILWYPIASDQIRAETFAKKGSRKDIPEY